jgi:hypothetical protein
VDQQAGPLEHDDPQSQVNNLAFCYRVVFWHHSKRFGLKSDAGTGGSSGAIEERIMEVSLACWFMKDDDFDGAGVWLQIGAAI